MQFLAQLFTNKLFLAPGSGWFCAQLLKIIIDTRKNGFNPDRLTGSGGMPSSHSATVMGLVTITAILYGPSTFEFVVSFFLAVIVIYDAAGVRLETQRQARALNTLNKERSDEGKEPLIERVLREKMGHTVPEILAGMLIGLICGLVCAYALPF